jgi:PAS domain S-box-containing protein
MAIDPGTTGEEWTADLRRANQQLRHEVAGRKRLEEALRWSEALLAGQKRVLEMVAKGDALPGILDALCRMVEEQSSDILSSFLLLDANGTHLRHGAAPRLPQSYIDAIDGVAIGPTGGSCITAAYRAAPVVVSDIAADPLWAAYRDLPLAHGLRACWSTPIISSEGNVLGTFAMYYREPRSPSLQDLNVLEQVASLAAVSIKHKQAEECLRRSQAYLAEAQKLTHTGSWAVNVATGEPSHSSAEHSHLFGFNPEHGVPSREELLQRIHPEDLNRVVETYDRAVVERVDVEVDFRSVLPNGTMKCIHSVGHPVFNVAGDLVEFVGTVMDVSERKRAEEELRASEQVTRGQIEALTQSLDVLATAPAPDQFIGQMLGTIRRQLGGQRVELFLFEEASESLVLRLVVEGENLVPIDSQHPFVRDPALWKQNRVVKDLIVAGAPVVIEDIETDPRVPVAVRKYLKSGGTKKSVGVPILASGKVKGVIGVRHGDRPPYRREEIELMQALAHQVMLALRLTELADQSRRAAILEERNRMARDIHDTLAQGFTGVIMQLEAAEKAIERRRPKLVNEYLRRAGKLARQSLSEARRSMHALRPEALKESNFWDALKEMIKSITVGTALHPSFKAQGKVDQLPPVWQENLLHIGQEALANTIKYAHAHKFGTRLVYDPKELRLEFSDDGDGFNPKDRHDGLGLAGMRERVEQMGGELRITSSRGKGTKITVVLPSNGESML